MILILVAALIALILLTRKHEPPRRPQPTVQAEIVYATVKPLQLTVNAIGTVSPKPGYAAHVSAPESSRIVRIHIAVGDRVRAGQPLVELDRTVFAARVQQATISRRAAQDAFDRTRRLVAEGISPRKDLDSAAADLARASAEYEQARHTEELSILRSPISGIVSELNATLSQPVDITQSVVSIVNPAGFEILFHITPSLAAQIAPGSRVTFGSTNDSTFRVLGAGSITGVGATLDSVTRSTPVRAAVTLMNRPLKARELIEGRIVLREIERAVVIPSAAIVPEGDVMHVFVVDTSDIAHSRPITIGARTETEVQILNGLHGGERVATTGAYSLVDGAKVLRPGRAK